MYIWIAKANQESKYQFAKLADGFTILNFSASKSTDSQPVRARKDAITKG